MKVNSIVPILIVAADVTNLQVMGKNSKQLRVTLASKPLRDGHMSSIKVSKPDGLFVVDT